MLTIDSPSPQELVTYCYSYSLGATSSISLENCNLGGFHETWRIQSTYTYACFSRGVHVVQVPVRQKSKMAANMQPHPEFCLISRQRIGRIVIFVSNLCFMDVVESFY